MSQGTMLWVKTLATAATTTATATTAAAATVLA